MKDVALTDEARRLVECLPSVVNYVAAALGDNLDALVGSHLFDLSPEVQDTRLYRLRTLPAGALAAWLESELGDSVPCDWLAWLADGPHSGAARGAE